MRLATDSCGCKGDGNKIGPGFAMLKTVRDDTKSKSLNLCFGLFWSIPICENPG